MEDDSDFSGDSDMEEEYGEEVYQSLQTGKLNVKLSSGHLVCPCCPDKKRKTFDYIGLSQHASGFGSSSRRSSKVKASHRALYKYLQELPEGESSSKRRKTEDQSADVRIEDTIDHNEMIVCPWKAVVVNIPTTKTRFQSVGEAGSKLRDEYIERGFNPTRVRTLWNHKGHSGTALVEFNKDLSGLKNAVMFDKAYRLDGQGKKDWLAKDGPKSGLYAWIARADDYTEAGIIGENLKKRSYLRTVAEEMRKQQILEVQPLAEETEETTEKKDAKKEK